MRVKVSATGLYTYPDVAVVCGKPRFDDDQEDTLLNPTVIIEVLSKSTEAYDRSEKFAQYRALELMTDYFLIAQDIARLEHYVRQPDGSWRFLESTGLDAVAVVGFHSVPAQPGRRLRQGRSDRTSPYPQVGCR